MKNKDVAKNPFERLQKVAVLALCVVLAGNLFSCSKSTEKASKGVYYVVGYDGRVDIQKGTAKSYGYLLISEKFKDLLLDENLSYNIISGSLDNIILLTSLIVDMYGNRIDDPFDGIIDFPEESMPPLISMYCGYRLFPKEYRFRFKVQITYRPMTEEEERAAVPIVLGICDISQLYSYEQFNKVVIKSINKIK